MGKERYVKVKSPLFEDAYWEGLALRSSIRKDVLKLDGFVYQEACAFHLNLGFDDQPWTLENLREIIHKFTRIPARRIVFAEQGRDLEADFEFDGGETLARNYKLSMRICRDAVGRCGVPASPDARPLEILPDAALGACVAFCRPRAVAILGATSKATRERLVADVVGHQAATVFARFYGVRGLDDVAELLASHAPRLSEWTATHRDAILDPALALALSRGVVADAYSDGERERALAASGVRWKSCERTWFHEETDVRQGFRGTVVLADRLEVSIDTGLDIYAESGFGWAISIEIRVHYRRKSKAHRKPSPLMLASLGSGYGDLRDDSSRKISGSVCEQLSAELELPAGVDRLLKFLALVLAGPLRWERPAHHYVPHESLLLLISRQIEVATLIHTGKISIDNDHDFDVDDEKRACQRPPPEFERPLFAWSAEQDSGWWSRYVEPAN